MSAASWSLKQDGKFFGTLFVSLIDLLFFFDKNHCAESWLSENTKQ